MQSLYVGNLAWEVTDDDLFNLLVETGTNPHGAEIIFSRSGRSLGYGLATFNTEEDAANAINQLNETEFQGRNIVVRYDRGANTKPARAPKSAPVERVVNDLGLYVGNLSWDTTEEAVAEVFASFNPADVALKLGRDGRSRGFAIVSFNSPEEAQGALDAMNGVEVDGRELKCRLDEGGGLNSKKSRAPVQYDDVGSSQAPVSSGGMPNTVYIGNLAWEVSDDDLFNLLVECNTNPQSAEVVFSRSGRSLGYALATFNSEDDAANAINQLNETEFQGRNIVVRPDRGTNSKPARAPKAPVERVVNDLALYVGNLSWGTTEEAVSESFSSFNPTDVFLKLGRDGRSRGFAIVSFNSVEEAQTALDAMNGVTMDGRELKVRFDGQA